MRLTTLIVDDEPLAREGLRMFLQKDADISSIAEARNGREAVKAIREAKPDLVLLDVQMPELDGLSVVREIGAERMPAVVFVTAHDRYAIQAFEINAIDYLLKPVTEKRFSQAILRVKDRLHTEPDGDSNRQIIALLETMASPQRFLKRAAVKSAGKTTFVNMKDVEWIEAAQNYVQLHTGRTSHLLHVTLGALAKMLDPEVFLPIHRSIIVNVGCVQELEPAGHGEYVVRLQNGIRLRSGRTYFENLKSLAANPF
jgi:two-component system LytT family response regulator